MDKIIGIIIVGVVIWFAYSMLKPPQWYGIYESRTSNDLFSQKFDSKEDCSAWLEDKREDPGAFTNYECGSDCTKPDRPLAVYECKDTF